MKPLLLLLSLALAAFAHAQQVSGVAKDESGTALAGATVSLIKDTSVVKLAVTGANGAYVFSGFKPGNYKVQLSHIGYQPVASAIFNWSGNDIVVPELRATKLAANLASVTVVARKPLVEVKADKMVLNVEGTINAMGTNAFELLRKSPGVLMDRDDNISLAGKNGIQVYVDGRPNPLSGQDLATYLKSLQSSQVEAIEIITNPSARYDAAGNAGIINIRLVKNKSLGANGSVNAGWNIAKHAQYNGGASLNYRNKQVNIYSNYSFSYAPNQQHINLRRTVLDSVFDQTGGIFDRRRTHNIKAGADWFVNKRSTIGIMVNAMLASPESNSFSRIGISKENTPTDRILVADNNTGMKRNNTNVNLNYTYTGAKGAVFSLNADRGAYDLNSDQYQRNYYYDAAGQVLQSSIIYHMVSPAKISINSVKADYEQGFLKGKLGFGAKTAWVETDNDFQRYDVSTSGEALDKDRSNHFAYKENIHAAYVNYNRQYKGVMVQAGLRAENTVTAGMSKGLKFNGTSYESSVSGFDRNYIDLFPSAAVTLNKNPKRQWGLTYSRRIDRPAYKDLNPFEFKLDEYTFMKGNVNLRPQYTNSIGVSHTRNFKLNMGLNYSHVSDMFTQLMDTTEKSKAFMSKRNLATQDVMSFSISYPFMYKSYTLFTSVNGNYSKYKADFGAGRQVDLDAFGLNVFVQNSLKFAKTWTAELSGFYNAPTVYQGSMKGKSMYNVDAGISKTCLQGRATIKASVSDIFYSMKFRASSDFAGQVMDFNFRQESRQFKLAMSFRFGKTGVKPAKQRTTGAEDEMKRVQQGGGMMGN